METNLKSGTFFIQALHQAIVDYNVGAGTNQIPADGVEFVTDLSGNFIRLFRAFAPKMIDFMYD